MTRRLRADEAIKWYYIQLVLNLVWAPIFFRGASPNPISPPVER